jgi:hypothetical protein
VLPTSCAGGSRLVTVTANTGADHCAVQVTSASQCRVVPACCQGYRGNGVVQVQHNACNEATGSSTVHPTGHACMLGQAAGGGHSLRSMVAEVCFMEEAEAAPEAPEASSSPPSPLGPAQRVQGEATHSVQGCRTPPGRGALCTSAAASIQPHTDRHPRCAG